MSTEQTTHTTSVNTWLWDRRRHYQATCTCGWQGLVKASDSTTTRQRRATNEATAHTTQIGA